MPRLITPMLASLRPELPHDDDRYGWEFKWDGIRAIAYAAGGQLRLLSRNGTDMTSSYPELGVLSGRVSGPVILDGEIVAVSGGRPDFGLLQSRMHVRHPPARLVQAVPVQLYLFDLLQAGGEPLLGRPYTARRERLEALGLNDGPVRAPPWSPGGAADVLAASRAPRPGRHRRQAAGLGLLSGTAPGLDQGQEPPAPGGHHLRLEARTRTPCGHHRLPAARRARPRRPTPRYAGHVGTGFTQAMLTDLAQRLHPLRHATSPFTPRCQPSTPAPRSGSSPGWSARSPSPNGPATCCCATRAGAGCGPAPTPATYRRAAEPPPAGLHHAERAWLRTAHRATVTSRQRPRPTWLAEASMQSQPTAPDGADA